MKRVIICLTVVLAFSSCMFNNKPAEVETTSDNQDITISLSKTADIDVAQVVCCVSAYDMDTIRVELNVSDDLITGIVPAIPFGDDRLFQLSCFNSDSAMNYYGETEVDINSFAPIVSIVLYPVNQFADVTIVGRFDTDEPTEEKIVFSADWEGSYDIYMMDTNGGNVRRLTFTDDVAEKYPRLSPDRTKVSFHKSSEDGPKLCIMDLQTLETRVLDIQGCNPQCADWHPNGHKLVFHSFTGNTGVFDICDFDLNTEEVRTLVEGTQYNWVPVYTPSGDEILFYSSTEPRWFKSCCMNADGSNLHMVNPDSSYEERLPHMSPADPNLILFSGRHYDENSYSQFGLFITDLSDSSHHVVTSRVGYNESWPEWSPDGTTIVYENKKPDGTFGIYVVNADGSGNQVLIDREGNELTPSWR